MLFLDAYSERLHEQIYSSIEGGAACFRRLNGTHQTGCSCMYLPLISIISIIVYIEITLSLWKLRSHSQC